MTMDRLGVSPERPIAGIAVELSGLGKVVRSGYKSLKILDGVSINFQSGEFIAILGASGSGKSTLVKSLAGVVPLSEGTIRLDGRRVSASELLRERRIAYLPQDIIVHAQLTPTRALGYIAELKGLVEVDDLIRRALDRVGLADRSGVPIHRLSGGQRKRVALAAELLGDPRLILLDEATSGLDPATEADMMDLFRSLADEGRTVVCITHFPGRLHLCDRLVCLKDGLRVFDGTPTEMKAFFGLTRIADVYGRMGERSAAKWQRRFDSTVRERIEALPIRPNPSHEGSRASPVGFAKQLILLTGRYIRLQIADVQALGLQLIQAPIIGAMIAATFGDIRSSFAEQAAADTKMVFFVLTLAVLWCSGTAGAREIVKELPIVRHERRFGLDLVSYLMSKMIWLGALAILQTTILLFIVRHYTHLTGPTDLQFTVLAHLGIVGVALGLSISALAGTSERAMTVLPVALIGLAIFSGGLARLVGVSLWGARIGSPAYWSLEGLKDPVSSTIKNATYPGAPGTFQPPILGSGETLALDVIVLLLQAAVLLGVAYTGLRYSLGHNSK